MKLISYRDVKKPKEATIIDLSNFIDLIGGKAAPLDPSKAIIYENAGFKFDDSGNSDTIMCMTKSKLQLRASYFRDGKFFVGRLTDFPKIFTDDLTLEALKQGLIDSFSLYYHIELDHVDVELELHEDTSLIETFA